MNCARALCGSPASGSNFAPSDISANWLYSLAMNQGHDRQIGGQFLLAQADPQADGVEGPVPIPLIAVAPGLVGVGLGLGDFLQRHFRDGGHEVQRAVDAGNHARGRRAAACRRRGSADRCGWGPASTLCRTRASSCEACNSASTARAHVRRESAIRHRGPHQRRIVASLRKIKADSSASPLARQASGRQSPRG